MSLDFGAAVGEIIGGALARGEGGRFINVADLALLQGEALQQLYDALREAAGLPPDPDGLREDKKKRKRRRRRKPKSEKPKTERKPRQRRRATSGRRQRRSSSRRNNRANRQAQKEAEQAANRALVSAALVSQGLSQAAFQALTEFRSGGPLTPEAQAALVPLGVIELDTEGQPRMTTQGSRIIRAASRGDSRTALDLLSKAKDKVKAKEERIANRVSHIQDLISRNNILTSEIEDIRGDIASLREQVVNESDPVRRARLEERAESRGRTLARRQGLQERTAVHVNRLTAQNEADQQSIGQQILKALNRLFKRIVKHNGSLITFPCPSCGHNQAKVYKDHGGLYVCEACHITYDPEFYHG